MVELQATRTKRKAEKVAPSSGRWDEPATAAEGGSGSASKGGAMRGGDARSWGGDGEGRGTGKESERTEGECNRSWRRLEVGSDLGRKPNEGPAALVSLLLNSRKENKVVFTVRTQERK